MIKIHVPGDGHVTPTFAGFKWDPFSDPKKKKTISDAIHILKNNVKGMKPCNDCFQRLPNGRTFDDILDDSSIFISFDPNNTGRLYGATLGNDVAITDFAIRMGRWTTAATLVHELAHVNGAPGNDHQAEGTLLCCGFSNIHDATIIGAVTGSRGETRAA